MIKWNLVKRAGSAGFSASDQAFYCTHIKAIDVAFFLVLQEVFNLFVLRLNDFVFSIAKELVETINEMHEAYYLFITYCDIS